MDCPTYMPSSLRMALLHNEPINRVFRSALDICTVDGVFAEGSMVTVSSTAYTSVTVCSFLVNVPTHQIRSISGTSDDLGVSMHTCLV